MITRNQLSEWLEGQVSNGSFTVSPPYLIAAKDGVITPNGDIYDKGSKIFIGNGSVQAPISVDKTPDPAPTEAVLSTDNVEIAEDDVEPLDLDSMSAAELKKLAAEKGLDVPARAKKADLIKLLK